MPFAVTHVLTAIIAVDLYRDYITKHKKHFTLHTVLWGGIAGLLPDIDIPLNFFLNFIGIEFVHRTFTHTTLFALLFLIPGFILWFSKKHKIAMYFFIACFGILLHLLLDFTFASDTGTGIMFLYPFVQTTFELNLWQYGSADFFAAMDALILLAWLAHEEFKHKISDYI